MIFKEKIKKIMLFVFDCFLVDTALIFLGPHISMILNRPLFSSFNFTYGALAGQTVVILGFVSVLAHRGVSVLLQKSNRNLTPYADGIFFTFFTFVSCISCYLMVRLIFFNVSFPKAFAVGVVFVALILAWLLPRTLLWRKALLFLGIICLFCCGKAALINNTIAVSDLFSPERDGVKVIAELPLEIDKADTITRLLASFAGILKYPQQIMNVMLDRQNSHMFLTTFNYHTTQGTITKLRLDDLKVVASHIENKQGRILWYPLHLENPDQLIAGFWRMHKNKLNSFRLDDLSIIRSISIDQYGGQFLAATQLSQEKILIASEEGHVLVFDKELNVLKNKRLPMMAQRICLDKDKRILAVAGCGGPTLMTLNADTLEVLNERWLSVFSITVEIDSASNRIFLTRVFFGDIVVCDVNTLETITKIPLEPGLRDVLYIPEKGLLVVNNYFNGNLYFINSRTYKLIRTIHIGSRGRSIQYSAIRDRLYLTTALRVLEVDINKVIK